MVMQSKYRSSPYVNNMDQDDPQTSSENGADSPLSGDERATATTAPSPRKSRRSIQKRVVQVPIGDGSRNNADVYPPSDSWAWRKYGQKPIKGSPYPRGYYRCSSFKGCPARKQVERSRVDPTTLLITYASEHNHHLPTFKHHHKTVSVTTRATTPPLATPSTPIAADDSPDEGGEPPALPSPLPLPAAPSPVQINPFGEPPYLEFVGDTLMLGNSGIEYNWMPEFTFSTPIFVGPRCDDAEVATFSIREEDQSLFGDLDELPECSTVFRRGQESVVEMCAQVAPLCGST